MTNLTEGATIAVVPRRAVGKGQVVGYARVSTQDQSLDVQIEQLTAAGAERIFYEKLSGVSKERPELEKALAYVREGDLLIVTRVDRLARSTLGLWSTIDTLKKKKVDFAAILQPQIDTTSTTGRLMLTIMGALAEMERDLLKERQREGIAAARAKKVYERRDVLTKRIKVERAAEMRAQGFWPNVAAKELGLKKTGDLYKYSPGSWLDDPRWVAAAKKRYAEAFYDFYEESKLRQRMLRRAVEKMEKNRNERSAKKAAV